MLTYLQRPSRLLSTSRPTLDLVGNRSHELEAAKNNLELMCSRCYCTVHIKSKKKKEVKYWQVLKIHKPLKPFCRAINIYKSWKKWKGLYSPWFTWVGLLSRSKLRISTWHLQRSDSQNSLLKCYKRPDYAEDTVAQEYRESIQAYGVTLVSVGCLFSSETHNIASGRESIEPQKSNPVYTEFKAQCAAISHQINFLIAHQPCNAAAVLTQAQVMFRLTSIVSMTYFVSFVLYLWIQFDAANVSQQDRDHPIGISLLWRVTSSSNTYQIKQLPPRGVLLSYLIHSSSSASKFHALIFIGQDTCRASFQSILSSQ